MIALLIAVVVSAALIAGFAAYDRSAWRRRFRTAQFATSYRDSAQAAFGVESA